MDNDRVRENTSEDVNLEIDQVAESQIRKFASMGRDEMTRRIDELDREWDIERVLETNASVIALSGLILGATHNKKWLIVPGIVTTFLFQHAVQGWCPPVPLFRRLGVRTRREIDEEKYALKAIRGDFDGVSSGTHNVGSALQAVRA